MASAARLYQLQSRGSIILFQFQLYFYVTGTFVYINSYEIIYLKGLFHVLV